MREIKPKLPDGSLNGLDFSGTHVLPDTGDFLDLFAHTGLMEHLNETQLAALFERSGYVRAPDYEITYGIGRKLGPEYANSANAVVILTADQKLVFLHCGTSGLYSLHVLADASSSADRAVLLGELERLDNSIVPLSISPRVVELRDTLRQAKDAGEIPEVVRTLESSDRQATTDLGEWVPRCGPNPGRFSNE